MGGSFFHISNTLVASSTLPSLPFYPLFYSYDLVPLHVMSLIAPGA